MDDAYRQLRDHWIRNPRRRADGSLTVRELARALEIDYDTARLAAKRHGWPAKGLVSAEVCEAVLFSRGLKGIAKAAVAYERRQAERERQRRATSVSP